MPQQKRHLAELSDVAHPHSEESERAVLGAVLLDPAFALPRVRRLAPEDFYLDQHQILFRAICALRDQETVPDLRTLQAYLEQSGSFEKSGGISYLATLDLDLPDIGRLDHYVDIVAERATRRKLIRLGSEAIREGAGHADIEEALARLQGQVPTLLAAVVRPRLQSLAQILPALMEKVEERGGEALRGIPTGFQRLDDMTGGLHGGNLIVLAGRPGLGKSALAANIALNLGIRQARPVGLWSLEMTAEEVTLRMICSEADVPSELLRQGHLSQGQWRRLVHASRSLAEAPILIDDSPSLTMAQLEGRIRRAFDEHAIAAAFVDYLQLLQGGGRFENRNAEVAFISRALKGLAKSLRIPICALAQLNRDTARRAGFRPTLADLRDSGAIEADADAVLFVHREHAYDPEALPGDAEVIVAKQRNGRTGTVPLIWVGETTSFRNPAELAAAAGTHAEGDPF